MCFALVANFTRTYFLEASTVHQAREPLLPTLIKTPRQYLSPGLQIHGINVQHRALLVHKEHLTEIPTVEKESFHDSEVLAILQTPKYNFLLLLFCLFSITHEYCGGSPAMLGPRLPPFSGGKWRKLCLTA
jgi:hypothetical protein